MHSDEYPSIIFFNYFKIHLIITKIYLELKAFNIILIYRLSVQNYLILYTSLMHAKGYHTF